MITVDVILTFLKSLKPLTKIVVSVFLFILIFTSVVLFVRSCTEPVPDTTILDSSIENLKTADDAADETNALKPIVEAQRESIENLKKQSESLNNQANKILSNINTSNSNKATREELERLAKELHK